VPVLTAGVVPGQPVGMRRAAKLTARRRDDARNMHRSNAGSVRLFDGAGGDRERHAKKLDAALGERCGRSVDERGGVGDPASATRDAWCDETKARAD
jgi:hypothetical protein